MDEGEWRNLALQRMAKVLRTHVVKFDFEDGKTLEKGSLHTSIIVDQKQILFMNLFIQLILTINVSIRNTSHLYLGTSNI